MCSGIFSIAYVLKMGRRFQSCWNDASDGSIFCLNLWAVFFGECVTFLVCSWIRKTLIQWCLQQAPRKHRALGGSLLFPKFSINSKIKTSVSNFKTKSWHFVVNWWLFHMTRNTKNVKSCCNWKKKKNTQ